MRGGVKKFLSLVNKPKSRVSTVFKPRKITKRKHYLLKPKRFKTLKRKIEKEVDDSDLGQLKSYKLCLAFIEKFLKKYETVMNLGNVEKESNYSLFVSMLATNISKVNEEYSEIIDESELTNNSIINILLEKPDEYLEKYIEYVEEEDILKDYKKAIEKYFNSFNKNKMNINNNNSEQEYITYSSFIRDSVNAVKETIIKYSTELKTKKKIANNINIDDLVMGLTAVKIKGDANSVPLSNDFLNKFLKLGL